LLFVLTSLVARTANESDLLPPDRAFPLVVTLDSLRQVMLDFQTRTGYYLYRNVSELSSWTQTEVRSKFSPAVLTRGADMKPSQVKPISYLKSHAAEIVRDITESGEPMLITQNGEAKVVVQDAQSYEDMQQTVALLKILAMGQKDIEAGNFTPAEEVFAELERMDREEGIE
jgi:prevent-host-death family protein